MMQMLELSDKDFKALVIKCFSEQLWAYLKQVKIKESLSTEMENNFLK